MSKIDGIQFLMLNAMDYDLDLEPQPFGIVEEILRIGIEISIP